MWDDEDNSKITPAPLKHGEKVAFEEAINSLCPLCGYKLEWEVKLVYDTEYDENRVEIESRCCGKTFCIYPFDGLTTVATED